MNRLFESIILPTQKDHRGQLVFGEAEDHLPFAIQRIFYITGVKKNGQRGFHAHKATRLALFCLKGSSLIRFDNGLKQAAFEINQPHSGVLIEPLIWHSMEQFRVGTILLAIASHHYDADDYIRDYAQFKALVCN